MKTADCEDLLLKHYRNLRKLIVKQLAAIEAGDGILLEEIIQQKEMIIGEIRRWHSAHDVLTCTPDTTATLREMINEIIVYENNSRKELAKRQEDVRKLMVAKQKDKLIQQAYGGTIWR